LRVQISHFIVRAALVQKRHELKNYDFGEMDESTARPEYWFHFVLTITYFVFLTPDLVSSSSAQTVLAL
jgi:hypothetical protein